jgi:hypothetical protein
MDRIERRLGKPGETPQLTVAASQPAAASAATSSQPPEVEAEAAKPADVDATDELARAAAPLVSDEPELVTDAAPIDISFEQLQKIWPGLFGGLRDLLGARRWAFFREAVPAAVERNTIILEVAHDFHLSSLEQDDAVGPIVAAKAGDLLGGQVKVKFRLKNGGDGGDDDNNSVDLTQLHDRPESSMDPASLLESELGARVVDD